MSNLNKFLQSFADDIENDSNNSSNNNNNNNNNKKNEISNGNNNINNKNNSGSENNDNNKNNNNNNNSDSVSNSNSFNAATIVMDDIILDEKRSENLFNIKEEVDKKDSDSNINNHHKTIAENEIKEIPKRNLKLNIHLKPKNKDINNDDNSNDSSTSIIKKSINETKINENINKSSNFININDEIAINNQKISDKSTLTKKEKNFIKNREIENRVKRELEEDLKRERAIKENKAKERTLKERKNQQAQNQQIKVQQKETQKTVKNIIKEDINDIENSKNSENNEKLRVEKMFENSETALFFKEKWMALYQKAINSDKKTLINDKIRRGRFRINEEGKMEILPDFETKGKSSKQLLRESWKI